MADGPTAGSATSQSQKRELSDSFNSQSFLESTPAKDLRGPKASRKYSPLAIPDDFSPVNVRLDDSTHEVVHHYPIASDSLSEVTRCYSINSPFPSFLPPALVGEEQIGQNILSGENIQFGDLPPSGIMDITQGRAGSSPMGTEEQAILKVVNANFSEMLENSLKNQNKSLGDTLTQSINTTFNALLKPFLTELVNLKKRVIVLENTIVAKNQEIDYLRYKSDSQDQKNRALNLKFCGIAELEDEDVDNLVEGIIEQIVEEFDNGDIRVCHRVGRPTNPGEKPRPILVKFSCSDARSEVFKARKKLKNHENMDLRIVFINEDLAPVRSRFLFVSRGLKKAKLINKYWIYDCEVFVKLAPESDPLKVINLSTLSMFNENPVFKRLTAPRKATPPPAAGGSNRNG
jgi:hypothetical protein